MALLTSRGLIVKDDAGGAYWLGIIGDHRLSGYTYAYRQLVNRIRTDRLTTRP